MYFYTLSVPGNTKQYKMNFLIVTEREPSDTLQLAKAIAIKYGDYLRDIFKFLVYKDPITLHKFIEKLDFKNSPYSSAYYQSFLQNIDGAKVFYITSDDLKKANSYYEKITNYNFVEKLKNIVNYYDNVDEKTLTKKIYESIKIVESIGDRIKSNYITREMLYGDEIYHYYRLDYSDEFSESHWYKKDSFIYNKYWIGLIKENTIEFTDNANLDYNDTNKNVKMINYADYTFEVVVPQYKKIGESIRGEVYELDGKIGYINNDKVFGFVSKDKIEEYEIEEGSVVYITGKEHPILAGQFAEVIKVSEGVITVFTQDCVLGCVSPFNVKIVGKLSKENNVIRNISENQINVANVSIDGSPVITSHDLTSGAIPGRITTYTRLPKYKNKSGSIMNIFYADKNNVYTTTVSKKQKNKYAVKTVAKSKKDNSEKRYVFYVPNVKEAIQLTSQIIKNKTVLYPYKISNTIDGFVFYIKDDKDYCFYIKNTSLDAFPITITEATKLSLPTYKTQSFYIHTPSLIITKNNILKFYGLKESDTVVTNQGVIPLIFINNSIFLDNLDLETVQEIELTTNVIGNKLTPDGKKEVNTNIPQGQYIVIFDIEAIDVYLIDIENKEVYELSSSDYYNYLQNNTIKITNTHPVNARKKLVSVFTKSESIIDSLDPVDYRKNIYNVLESIPKNIKPYSACYLLDNNNKKIAIVFYRERYDENSSIVIVARSFVKELEEGDIIVVDNKNLQTSKDYPITKNNFWLTN